MRGRCHHHRIELSSSLEVASLGRLTVITGALCALDPKTQSGKLRQHQWWTESGARGSLTDRVGRVFDACRYEEIGGVQQQLMALGVTVGVGAGLVGGVLGAAEE